MAKLNNENGSIEEGLAAYERDDYETTARLLQPLAEQGNAIAQYVFAYEGGDFATAVRLLQPLAEQGNAIAQFYLGNAYKFGEGVTQDYSEAVKWYRLAAEQGYDQARLSISIMYHYGLGVPKDEVQAKVWSDRAHVLVAIKLRQMGLADQAEELTRRNSVEEAPARDRTVEEAEGRLTEK